MQAFQRIDLLLLLAGLIGCTACEESIDWELQPGENGRLVVEATLTDERKIQEVRLSTSYDELNGSPAPVTDAEVRVEANGSVLPFRADPQSPGLYRSTMPFAMLADLEYTLHIEWQQEQFTASGELAEVTPLPPITFQDFGKRDSLAFGNFAPLYHPDQQSLYIMQVDWSHLSGRPTDQARLYYYTFSSIDAAGLVRPLRDTVFFPRGSRIIARKLGLSDAYADYLHALVIETDWPGGAFYGTAASLPTNISNGGLGFFGACAVVGDTVVAE